MDKAGQQFMNVKRMSIELINRTIILKLTKIVSSLNTMDIFEEGLWYSVQNFGGSRKVCSLEKICHNYNNRQQQCRLYGQT